MSNEPDECVLKVEWKGWVAVLTAPLRVQLRRSLSPAFRLSRASYLATPSFYYSHYHHHYHHHYFPHHRHQFAFWENIARTVHRFLHLHHFTMPLESVTIISNSRAIFTTFEQTFAISWPRDHGTVGVVGVSYMTSMVTKLSTSVYACIESL